MNSVSDQKIILVRSKTRLEDLVYRFNTVSQTQFYIEHMGADFSDYQKEHDKYHSALDEAQKLISSKGRIHVIDRSFLPNFIFGPNDIVVAVGRDGIVANTLKYLDSQVLIGVNPDRDRWDGILVPFSLSDLSKVIQGVLENTQPIQGVTLAKITLNDGQTLHAVNDFFIGQKTHTSARYTICHGTQKENHSSSGIIVSTGLGSTGWFKSIVTGATRIYQQRTKSTAKNTAESSFKWDSNFLYFSVREPFPSNSSQVDLVFGKITPQQPLTIVSNMPENGVIFSDGIENDYLQFNAGIQATVTLSEKKGKLARC